MGYLPTEVIGWLTLNSKYNWVNTPLIYASCDMSIKYEDVNSI